MFQHLAGLRAYSEVQEKLFLIVINIQKKQTICFQITGMPSLSFLYNICTWRMAGEPSGRAAWRCEHNEVIQDYFSFSDQKEGKGWLLCSQKGRSYSELLTSLLKLYAPYVMALLPSLNTPQKILQKTNDRRGTVSFVKL